MGFGAGEGQAYGGDGGGEEHRDAQVAGDVALSVVLFSALGVASVFMGFSIDGLDIQLLQAVAQTASFLMALLW